MFGCGVTWSRGCPKPCQGITLALLIPPLSQVVHLDNMKHEEEIQKFPLQTPYYDMAPPEASPYSDKLVRSQGWHWCRLAPHPSLAWHTGPLTLKEQDPHHPQPGIILSWRSLHTLISAHPNSAFRRSQSCAFMGKTPCPPQIFHLPNPGHTSPPARSPC